MLSSYMFMLLQRHVKMAYRIRTKQGSTVVVSVLHVLNVILSVTMAGGALTIMALTFVNVHPSMMAMIVHISLSRGVSNMRIVIQNMDHVADFLTRSLVLMVSQLSLQHLAASLVR